MRPVRVICLNRWLFWIFLAFLSCSPEGNKDYGDSFVYQDNENSSAGTTNSGSGGVTGASTVLTSVSAGNSLGTGSGPASTCADITVATSRATPWVLFVIDRSQTMNEAYTGSGNRWQAIYDTLMAPGTGVISKLQSAVYFGIMLFDGQGTCPRLETVEPALNNYNKINAVYGAASPGQYTPTALALNAAYKLLPSTQQGLDTPDGIGDPYVVLCTDGEPNGCPDGILTGGGALATDFQGPINEVTTAAKNGIKTFVVSVASGGQQYQQFLEQLADIGNTGSPAFAPATKDELAKQLGGIVGNAIGCNIKLNGRVTVGKECTGNVTLNSIALTCNDPNGWKLVDETHIELLGTACDSFMNDPTSMLSTSFPCGVVQVI
jgi:hypothetical protein